MSKFLSGTPDSILLFGEALRNRGFSEKGVEEALGTRHQKLKTEAWPYYRKRVEADDPLHVLIRLFGLGDPVQEAQARSALEPAKISHLEDMGIIESGGGMAVSSMSIGCVENTLVIHDPATDGWEGIPEDYVVGVGQAPLTLAKLTVRRKVGNALDLGTGCGIQALLAALHARTVTATDINPRAMAMARFNCALNGIPNVDVVEGNLFEPMRGRTFDLIVSNPPYVISPDQAALFRDGGMEGDRLCQEVVTGAAKHLATGGFATVLCNWIQKPDEAWDEPPRRWIRGLECDGWVLRLGSFDALKYAASWTQEPDEARYTRTLSRWMDHYSQAGIQRICAGVVILKRLLPDQEPSIESDKVPGFFGDDRGDQIEAISRSRNDVRGFSEEDYLSQPFRRQGETELARVMHDRDGPQRDVTRSLRWSRGVKLEMQLDEFEERLIHGLDGRRSLGELVDGILGEVEEGTTASDRSDARQRAVSLAATLARRGHIVRADGADGVASGLDG